MDTQSIPVVKRVLAFAKIQLGERVLVLGRDAEAIATVTNAIDPNRLVVAEDFQHQHIRLEAWNSHL
jgi:hypothetical protein